MDSLNEKKIWEVWRRLNAVTEKQPVDWDAFDDILRNAENINMIDEKYEETILTEFIGGLYFEDKDILVEGVRHFLSCGYDVLANGGRNGGKALNELLWSTYDRSILDAAKLLMDAGAPVIFTSNDDEPDEEPRGLMGALGFKIPGAWSVAKDYDFANVLEAYYKIAEANLAGKDYNSIKSYHACIGNALTSVSVVQNEAAAGLHAKDGIMIFGEALVMWFGNEPLIVNKYAELIVDPNYAEENKAALKDENAAFELLIGAKLVAITYVDSVTCYLDFDNGYRFILASCDIGNRDREGRIEIRPVEMVAPERLTGISSVCARSRQFSSTCIQYDEEAFALFCDDGAYLLYLLPGEDEFHMALLRCSTAMVKDFTRRYLLGEIESVSFFKEQEEIKAVEFKCSEGFLYARSRDVREMDVLLADCRLDPFEYDSLHMHKGRHIRFGKRNA